MRFFTFFDNFFNKSIFYVIVVWHRLRPGDWPICFLGQKEIPTIFVMKSYSQNIQKVKRQINRVKSMKDIQMRRYNILVKNGISNV